MFLHGYEGLKMSIAIKRNFTIPLSSAIGASELYLSSNTGSTSTGTGALQVSGGAGISGDLVVGGLVKFINGSYFTAFDSAATASTTYYWPTSSPASGTSVLSSDSAGNMSWVLMSASGSGLTLNGLSVSTQYFSSNISGSGFTIGSIGSTHTFYIALAGNASTGLVSSTGQTFFGLKTFASGLAITSTTGSGSTTTGALTVSGGIGIGGSLNVYQTTTVSDNILINSAKETRFYNSVNTFYTGLKAGVTTTNTTFTLPISDGTANQVLYTNGSAALGWTTVSSSSGSGISSLNGLGATSQTFATSISGSGFTIGSSTSTHTFYLGLAGNASTGLISATTQSLYGAKTFINDLSVVSSTASTSSTTGALVVSGGIGVAGNINIAGNLSTVQTTEKYYPYTSNIGSGAAVTLASNSNGGIMYVNTGTVSGNWILDVTGLAITNGFASSITVIISQGATAYIPTTLRISGVGQTINWQGNVVPTGNSSKKDVIAFSILSTGTGTTDYLVFGQLVTFG